MIRRPASTSLPALPTGAGLGSIRAAAAALAVGCASPEGGGAELLVPDVVAVEWDASYNERGDGLGALIPLDVMVYDGANGGPVPDVSVTLLIDEDEGVVAVPVGAAEFLDAADGDVLDEVLWDSRHDQYLTLRPPSDTDGGRTVQLTTDGWGIARWYLFVDAFPESSSAESGSGSDFDPIPLTVSNGTDETFLLTPQ